MNWFEVLVEGAADVPVLREVLTRRFGLVEGAQFRLHAHRGRGTLPADVLSQPPPHKLGLLDQLPAKLRGWSWLGPQACVVVVVDADNDDCKELLRRLHDMLVRLPKRPARVLFRLAIEETESWFLADRSAIERAYPKARLAKLMRMQPDAVVGAWEVLANVIGMRPDRVSGLDKFEWANRIAPHLNLDQPGSPSLGKLIAGLSRELAHSSVPQA